MVAQGSLKWRGKVDVGIGKGLWLKVQKSATKTGILREVIVQIIMIFIKMKYVILSIGTILS